MHADTLFDPKSSNELMFIERRSSAGGLVMHGDIARIRTRRAMFLQERDGVYVRDRFEKGLENPSALWVVEREAGGGTLNYKDRVYFRHLVSGRYLSFAGSAGAIVLSSDKGVDEAWSVW